MKTGYTFSHFGIPAKDKSHTPIYAEPLKLWMSDFNQDPYCCEWLYFEKGSPFPELIKSQAHVAYVVASLAEALKGEKVIVDPTPCGDITFAFIEADGYAVELIEVNK